MTKFRKITIVRHNLLGSNIEGNEGILVNEIHYDESGHETERFNYTSEGELEEHIIYELSEGRVVEEKLEINGELTERTTRSFDDDGKVISETRYYSEGGTDITTFEYEEGHLIQKLVTDTDGEEGEKEIREYSDGKINKEVLYDLFGKINIEKVFNYNDEGKISEIIETSFQGEQPEKTISLFDDQGRLTMEKKYDHKERLIARSIIEYSENGNASRIEEETVRGKKITVLDYDEAGNNTHQEETDQDGKRISLVERIFNEAGQPLFAEVMNEPTLYHPGNHYRLEYIYE